MAFIDDIDTIKRLLQDDARRNVPLSELIATGRTDDIIERGAQQEAKAAIMAERDSIKRQRLILQHMPLFNPERN